MPKLKLLIATVFVGGQSVMSAIATDGSGGEADDAAEIKALKQQVEALLQRVNALEQQHGQSGVTNLALNKRQEPATNLAGAQSKIILGANGLSFSSADTNVVVQLHGVIQLDSRTFFEDHGAKGVDGFLLRRARPILSGTVYRVFDYNLTPDFGGSTVQIPDAYATCRYAPEFQIQVGKFKSPIGLEHLQSDRDLSFNERSLATDLVPNRDLGLLLKGDLADGAISYAVGLLDGAPDYNATTTNTCTQNDQAFVARTFFQPWKNSEMKALQSLGFGLAGSYELDDPATNSATGLTPGYTTDGQQKFFTYSKNVYADGRHWRVSPQACYYNGPFGLLGEYVISDQRVSSGATGGAKRVEASNRAWEISGSWLLTGEDATYGAVSPRQNFDPRSGHWGAWQLVARYAELTVDDNVFTRGLADPAKSASGAQAWALGLNWYLNKAIRANLSFSRTTFNSFPGATVPGTVSSQPENVLFSRVQLAF